MRSLLLAFAVVLVALPARGQAPSVEDDRVRIGDVVLPGYPAPRRSGSGDRTARHPPPRLTHAVLDPSRTLVAVAGQCFGCAGVAAPVTPSCAAQLVRVFRVRDGVQECSSRGSRTGAREARGREGPAGEPIFDSLGALVASFGLPWSEVADEISVLAMSFDPDSRRLAVLTRLRWSDCSYEGAELHLAVVRVEDGALLERRVLSRRGALGEHTVALRGDAVEITTRRGARSRTRTLALGASVSRRAR